MLPGGIFRSSRLELGAKSKGGMRILELFSGIGGMHCAAKRVYGEAEIALHADINPNANTCYTLNFPEVPMSTVAIDQWSVADFDRVRADMLLLSPPCQPYTRMGRQRDEDDPRAAALLRICSILADTQRLPSRILLENVKGFERSESCRRVRTTLLQRGYHIRQFILSPLQFGIPNERVRYYLVASLQPLRDSLEPHAVYCAIPGSWDGERTMYPMGLPVPAGWTALQEDSVPPAAICVTPIAAFLDENVSESYRVPCKTLEQQYASCLDIVDPSSTRSACFTKSYGRYLKGTGSVLRDGGHVRYFSPTEIARLLGFPDSFTFPHHLSFRQKAALLGNSLHVDVVAALLRHLQV